MSEQLVTAAVQTSESYYGQPSIQVVDDRRRKAASKIHVSPNHQFRKCKTTSGRDILNIGESFSTQQFLGHKEWGEAKAAALREANRGRFRWTFISRRSPRGQRSGD